MKFDILKTRRGRLEAKISEEILNIHPKIEKIMTYVEEHEKELADKQKQLEALAQKYNDLSKEIAESTEITEEERTAKFAELVINRTKEAESIFPEDSETYVMSVVFLTLKALADLDGQGHKVTKANFAKCPYVKTKLMLAKLLIQNEISEVGIIFLPPKNLD